MVRKALLLATGISAALIAVAPQTNAQSSAPRVRVTSRPYTNSGTIQPSVSLSEPSYMLAIAIDRDGQVSVLSPVGPNDVFRFNAEKSLLLPEFFAGFSSASYNYYDDYSYTRNYSYFRNTYEDNSAGSVLVIASKTPFNFAAIMDGPFWSEDAIQKLVRFRSPARAVAAIGHAVSAKGQSFGYDYLSFAPRPYQIASFDPCSASGFSPYGYGFNRGIYGSFPYSYSYVIAAPTTTSSGVQLIAMSDGCGRVRYMTFPIRILPPRDSVAPVDSTNMSPPATKAVIADAAPGTYTGEAAVRVYEMVKNRANSDTYAGLLRMPILQEENGSTVGRPVSRDAAPPERVETFERVRSAAPTPIERAPILRQAEPQQERIAQPVMRTEPVSQSQGAVQRESKPVEVTSTTKDN